MNTGSYDLVFEVNKGLLGKAVAEMHSKGLLSINGEYQIQNDQIPQESSAVTGVKYSLELSSPPGVEFTQEGKVQIFASAEAVFVTESASLEFDVDISVITDLLLDRDTNKIILDLANSRIDKLQFEDKYNLPADTIKKYHEILQTAVTGNLTAQYTSIDIPLVLYDQTLPFMPEGDVGKLDIELSGTRALDSNVLAVCFNLLKRTGGDINAVSDFTGGADAAVGISEDAMHQVFDFWWNSTTLEKGHSATSSEDTAVVDDFLNFISPMFSLGTKYSTLGFVNTEYRVDRAWVEYGASISFSKPEFDLKPGNVMDITDLLIKVSLWAEVKSTIWVSLSVDTSGFIPDFLTPWEDNIDIKHKTSTMTVAKLAMNEAEIPLNNAKGEIYLDDQNRIMGKINSIDLEISPGEEWYKYIPQLTVNKIIDFTKLLINNNVPELVLFPAVIDTKVPEAAIPLETATETTFHVLDDESILTASIRIPEPPDEEL